MTPADRSLVETYFRAMQAGADGEAEMQSIWADDAVYSEPFTGQGQRREHTGKEAISAFFHESHSQGMAPIRISLDRLDLDGGRLRSEWTCLMPGMPEFSGHDLYTIRDGKIARLEVYVDRGLGGPPPA
jgi:ketosteroid isomerase-like protein